ncbi:MAG: glycosyltransferase family 2 protein [Ruminococcaceae bacterium]|nr:glycosyltransferase family 2 protein [Oscillospiraceae bacterium]
MVSIIVPIYNWEKYIKECVNSLVNQTYKDIEILLVNDGSTDNTATILDKITDEDNRIRVIHKENGGVSSARNLGIEVAGGKYIMFCDCDNIVEIDWCEQLCKSIQLYAGSLPICWVKTKKVKDMYIW